MSKDQASSTKQTTASLVDRTQFRSIDSVEYIWRNLKLPSHALRSLDLVGQEGPAVSSSFKIGHLAQCTISLSALAAALIHAARNKLSAVPRVTVPLQHAVTEFKSERLHTLDGKPPASPWGTVGGLHRTADGYVRIHDSFPNHEAAILGVLGLERRTASREDAASAASRWKSLDLETEGIRNGAALAALRSYGEWDAHPQSRAIHDFPILISALANSSSSANGEEVPLARTLPAGNDRCLRGLRVLEFSRVIAAPVAGKTLAAHGADVLWVTSPTLPDQPSLDRDVGRGKRTVRLDFRSSSDDKARLLELVRDADVVIQSFRPGSFAAHGLGPKDLAAVNPNLIYASLSAYGSSGPWANRRGFDSLVQTCSGMNVSEAEHFGSEDESARPMPCQALDHGAGYLLATGIMAAVYHRMTSGGGQGGYEVEVSLAGVMKYLRSLGQYPGNTGFQISSAPDGDDDEDPFESRTTPFGELRAVRHSARVEGAMPGWDVMPKPLGSDRPEWLDS
jgi:hypothetical protein